MDRLWAINSSVTVCCFSGFPEGAQPVLWATGSLLGICSIVLSPGSRLTAKFRVDMHLSLAPLLRMLPFPSRYSCCVDKVLPFLTMHITGCLIPRLSELLAEIPVQWGALLAKPWAWHLHRCTLMWGTGGCSETAERSVWDSNGRQRKVCLSVSIFTRELAHTALQ